MSDKLLKAWHVGFDHGFEDRQRMASIFKTAPEQIEYSKGYDEGVEAANQYYDQQCLDYGH